MYKIKEVRLSRGITQSELANKIGVSRSAIAKYEKGERNPPLSLLQKIADVLKIPISDLGIQLPKNFENVRIVSPEEMFSNLPYMGEIFSNPKKKNTTSIVDTSTIDNFEDDSLNYDKIRNMLIDSILFYFNENDLYLSFDEAESLYEEVKEYIFFKIYLYKNK